jgi:hypothetical protein
VGLKPILNVQTDAQRNVPGIPNNGNPNGVHNNAPRRPPGFRTRVGGGYIGKMPEGSVQASNGVFYGGGALTPGQMQSNQVRQDQWLQQQQQQQMGRSLYGSGNSMADRMSILERVRGMMPTQGGGVPGLPVSMPGTGFQNSPNNAMESITGVPNVYGPQGNVVPQSQPNLNQYGQNTNTYYGGQNPSLGRYRPPQMIPGGGWADNGGYNYNLPNAYGPYPNYQTGPYGYGNGYG